MPRLIVYGCPSALTQDQFDLRLTEALEETKAGMHIQSATELRQYLLTAYREF